MSGDESIFQDAFSFLGRGGEMRELIREFDWASTPIGPVTRWSAALRTTIRIVLANRFPHILWWGPDYIQLYNDAYAPIPGAKHPKKALGKPASECWPEIWHTIGPLIDRPFRGGPPTWNEDILLEIQRHGFVEESHFTIAYSPVPDDTTPGGIGGVLATVHEITEKVISERRTVVLRDLAASVADAKTAEQACTMVAKVLDHNDSDVPFALLYLIDPDRRRARLAGAAGAITGPDLTQESLNLENSSAMRWPLNEVIESGELQVVGDLATRFQAVPGGPWSDPPITAAIVPIPSNQPHVPAAVLIAGISSRLKFDTHYRDFLVLVRTQIATAISNARSHEEERKRAEMLAELDRAKTVFFSNVSHEFRTPLTLMLGPIEEMLRRSYSELSPAVKDELEVVNRNGLRLLRLVNTLLDFSRIEAGRVRAIYQPTELASFTAELASMFRAAIERAGLKLVVDCQQLSEMVYVDREMWEKIVLNLLSNALKFTFEGQIEVRLRQSANMVELRVSDTGTGIPSEEMPHLFERFHRVENARSRTHEGSGIGLALVHELVRLHGGRIVAESVVDKGTTLIARVPMGKHHLPPDQVSNEDRPFSAATGASPFVEEALRWLPEDASNEERDRELPSNYREALATPALNPVNGKNRSRVIVADDNADMRQYISRILSERYKVEAVPDGEAALQAAAECKPDLILADVMMPRLDGFGLLRKIRSDPGLREIPVIVLSARAGEESRVEGMDSGADDYLVKPFSARELMARVEAHLKMVQMRRSAAEQESYRNAQFEVVVDRAPVGIILVDSDLRIRLANPIARPAFGQIPDLIGREFAEVQRIMWPRDFADEVIRRFRYTLETGESYANPESSAHRIDRNHTEYYEWRIDRTLLPDGRYGVVCYFEEISARVRAKQELERSRDALSRDGRRKSEFLSILAHELRNPLAPIANSLELIKRFGNNESVTAEARESIERQLSQMVRLVDDLLDVSRITRDKLELRTEPVDLKSIVEQSIEACRPLLHDSGLRLRRDFSREPIHLDADPVRLVQVFQNLLNNACKYTERGGEVTVTTKREDDAAMVSVCDTGIGIPSDRLGEVFEMFSQVHPGTIRPDPGLGIGLALVKRLVEMHKGKVEARSEGLGRGAEFVVKLPLVSETAQAVEARIKRASEKEPEFRLPPRRILVVDDHEDSAESMATLLELSGNRVQCAGDGLAALEAIERFDPQIVLLDIGLPKMNGYEVCRAIRRNCSIRQPIVVALTGWGQKTDLEESKEAGFDHHLVKPVPFEALLELMTKLNRDKNSTELNIP
jgi:signal transduction histidine kinase